MKVFVTKAGYETTVHDAKPVNGTAQRAGGIAGGVPAAIPAGAPGGASPDLGRVFHFTITGPVGNPRSPRVKNHPDDVRQIQRALNAFGPLDGGPVPKLVVDGKCGPLTQKAITHLQRKYQLFPKGANAPDGIVDVEGGTIDRLRAGPPAEPSAIPVIITLLPRVLQIIAAARATLALAAAHAALPTTPAHLRGLDFAGGAALAKVHRTFRNEKSKTIAADIRFIDDIFDKSAQALGLTPDGWLFAEDEPPGGEEGTMAYTTGGGFWFAKKRRIGPEQLVTLHNGMELYGGVVYYCPRFRLLSPEGMAYAIVHELAHFVGPETQPIIDDHAYFHRQRAKYDKLNAFQALHNGDSYAQFAFDAIGKANFNAVLGHTTY